MIDKSTVLGLEEILARAEAETMPREALISELRDFLRQQDLDGDDSDDVERCEVGGCPKLAAYEAWYRVHDPFGLPTGLLQKVQICEEHKTHPHLVANQRQS